MVKAKTWIAPDGKVVVSMKQHVLVQANPRNDKHTCSASRSHLSRNEHVFLPVGVGTDR